MAAQDEQPGAETTDTLTQEHRLIRPARDYGAFWDQHAAQGVPTSESVSGDNAGQTRIIDREQLEHVWKQASRLRVIEHFDLDVDDKRRTRDDEIWLKSPFTQEQAASMHVSLSENVFKDFSSGKGGGIIQFCREMLRRQGREMTMFQVGQWMIDVGICTLDVRQCPTSACNPKKPTIDPLCPEKTNAPIKVDLRRYLSADHPELHRRGIGAATCRYLGCGFLPQRGQGKASSPLNSRLVFQIRSLRQNGNGLDAVVVSHTGRALSREQEQRDGKYWSYPFHKRLEIYNQDRLLLDEQAREQVNRFGLVLVEGFFDVAKLIEAGCLNVAALMGTSISTEQIQRLVWIRERAGFTRILLFLDRDPAGRKAVQLVRQRLCRHNLDARIFDWDRKLSGSGRHGVPIPDSIKDPADMSVSQLRWMRNQRII